MPDKEYTPSDKEVQQDIEKAKQMNQNIFKETHPAEWKQQEDEKKKKEQEDAQYKDMVNDRMSQLKEEVNMNIEDFL